MEDIELSRQGTQPGENKYDYKFTESSSEFDYIILDAKTKKMLSEAKTAMTRSPRKRNP